MNLYPTNATESLHSQMRKISATRKMFPNDEAVIQILLHLRNFRNRWPRRPGWDVVLNQLAVMFGDRLKPEAGDALYL